MKTLFKIIVCVCVVVVPFFMFTSCEKKIIEDCNTNNCSWTAGGQERQHPAQGTCHCHGNCGNRGCRCHATCG